MSREKSVYFDPLMSERLNKIDKIDEYDRALSYKLSSSGSSQQNVNQGSKDISVTMSKTKDNAFVLGYAASLGVFLVTGIGALEWTLPTKMYNKFVNTLVPELKAIM